MWGCLLGVEKEGRDWDAEAAPRHTPLRWFCDKSLEIHEKAGDRISSGAKYGKRVRKSMKTKEERRVDEDRSAVRQANHEERSKENT